MSNVAKTYRNMARGLATKEEVFAEMLYERLTNPEAVDETDFAKHFGSNPEYVVFEATTTLEACCSILRQHNVLLAL